jgi:hypothetical protein
VVERPWLGRHALAEGIWGTLFMLVAYAVAKQRLPDPASRCPVCDNALITRGWCPALLLALLERAMGARRA